LLGSGQQNAFCFRWRSEGSHRHSFRARYYQDGGGDFRKVAGERMLQIGDALQKNCTARFVQCNFPMPYERQFGNFDWEVPHSLYATVAALNLHIAERARTRGKVLICDVDGIASWAGTSDLAERCSQVPPECSRARGGSKR
jgi:hypothetical protein